MAEQETSRGASDDVAMVDEEKPSEEVNAADIAEEEQPMLTMEPPEVNAAETGEQQQEAHDNDAMLTEEKPSDEFDAVQTGKDAPMLAEEEPSDEVEAVPTGEQKQEDAAIQDASVENGKRELDQPWPEFDDDEPPLAKVPRMEPPDTSSPLAFSTPKSAGAPPPDAKLALLRKQMEDMREKKKKLVEQSKESNETANASSGGAQKKDVSNPLAFATAKGAPAKPPSSSYNQPPPAKKDDWYDQKGWSKSDWSSNANWSWSKSDSDWSWSKSADEQPAKANWSWSKSESDSTWSKPESKLADSEEVEPKKALPLDATAPSLAAGFAAIASGLAMLSKPVEQPSVLTDPTLIAFANKWRLNNGSQELLKSLTPLAQETVMKEFSPRDTSRDANSLFRKFAEGKANYLEYRTRGDRSRDQAVAIAPTAPANPAPANQALAMQQIMAAAQLQQVQQLAQMAQLPGMAQVQQVQQAQAVMQQMSQLGMAPQLAQLPGMAQAQLPQGVPTALPAQMAIAPAGVAQAPAPALLSLTAGSLPAPMESHSQSSPAVAQTPPGEIAPHEAVKVETAAEIPPPKVYSEDEKKSLCKELRHDLRELGSMTSLQDNKAIPRVAEMAREKYIPAIGTLQFHSSLGDAFEKAKFTSHRKSIIYVLHELLMVLRKTKLGAHEEDFFPNCLNVLERIGNKMANLDEKERVDYEPLVGFWAKKKVFRPENLLQIKRWWGIAE